MTKLPTKFALAVSALALALPAIAGAQQTLPTPVEPTKVPAAEVELAGPALWQVSDEDTTIYLFGTVHVLPENVVWYDEDIAAALAGSEVLVTELIQDEAMAAEMQQLVMTKGVLPKGQTLRGLLSDEQRASYEAAMAKLGLPAAAFDRFEPWYAGMMLSMLPLMQQGYQLDKGVEMVLEQNAGEGMTREALETLPFQIGIFDGLPMDAQVTFMMEVAENIDEVTPMLDRMVAEWVEGDAAELARLMNEGMTDPVLAEKLLFARNRTWAEWIDERLDRPGKVFVAVGAGHLAGAESVQEALAARGIESKRVQ